MALALLLVALATAAHRVPKECSFARSKKAGQPLEEPLRLSWDPWTSSQLLTAIVGMLLQQGLGFNVELVELGAVWKSSDTADLYEAVSTGALHAALEVWPQAKSAQLSQFGSYDLGGASNRSEVTRYTNLVGRSGIYETCRRDSLSALGSCTDPLASALPKMLTDALSIGQAGVAHFSHTAHAPNAGVGTPTSAAECNIGLGCDGNIWRPPACAAERNCSVQLQHIWHTAYDKGQIEQMIARLGLPIEVAYVGPDDWARQVGHSYRTGQGGLFYSWYPHGPVAGIPMEKFKRATVPFGDDLPEAVLQKVHWHGLADIAEDAVALFKAFELSNADLDALVARPDVANGDIDSAACSWIKENDEVWSKWLRFPSRVSARFSFCGIGSSSWCSESAVLALFVQLGLAFVFLMCGGLVYGKHALDPDRVHAELQRHIDSLCANSRPVSVTRKSSTHYHLERLEKRRSSIDSIHSAPWRRRRIQKCLSLVWLYLSVVGHHIYALSLQPIVRFMKRQRATFQAKSEFDSARRGVPTFFSHVRTLENFVAGNVDPKLRLPPAGPADNWIAGHSRADMWIFFFSTRTWYPIVLQVRLRLRLRLSLS